MRNVTDRGLEISWRSGENTASGCFMERKNPLPIPGAQEGIRSEFFTACQAGLTPRLIFFRLPVLFFPHKFEELAPFGSDGASGRERDALVQGRGCFGGFGLMEEERGFVPMHVLVYIRGQAGLLQALVDEFQGRRGISLFLPGSELFHERREFLFSVGLPGEAGDIAGVGLLDLTHDFRIGGRDQSGGPRISPVRPPDNRWRQSGV